MGRGRDRWSGKFSRKSSLPETSFSCENAPKTLGGRAQPEPAGGTKSASPESLTAIGGDGMEHSLVGIRGRCVVWTGREEQSRVVWEEWEGNTVRDGGSEG